MNKLLTFLLQARLDVAKAHSSNHWAEKIKMARNLNAEKENR
jgi:hypothetical protein